MLHPIITKYPSCLEEIYTKRSIYESPSKGNTSIYEIFCQKPYTDWSECHNSIIKCNLCINEMIKTIKFEQHKELVLQIDIQKCRIKISCKASKHSRLFYKELEKDKLL